jgi:pimeloyl-ACP methyl ester carboxylesterase
MASDSRLSCCTGPHLHRSSGAMSSQILSQQVHVFDLLGYGLSERPWDPSIDTSISGQVSILEGLPAHWELQTAHLIAHDIGGAVAQRFAIFLPEPVRSLTLIDVVSFDSYAMGCDSRISVSAVRPWNSAATATPGARAGGMTCTRRDGAAVYSA